MTVYIEGYASRFGLRDLNEDVVVPGAFQPSLMSSGAGGVRMLYQHQLKSPIGVWDELGEDETGLFVRGRILEFSPEARMVAAMVKSGVIDGLSIGFRTQKSRKGQGGLRVLTQVELWEISIVTFPMLPSARITRIFEDAEAA
ncbi:MAG: HK97 family phage prohead protease [Asticcacaulis sp.]